LVRPVAYPLTARPRLETGPDAVIYDQV